MYVVSWFLFLDCVSVKEGDSSRSDVFEALEDDRPGEVSGASQWAEGLSVIS